MITIFLDPVSSANKIARKGFYKTNEETDSEESQTPTNTLPEQNEVSWVKVSRVSVQGGRDYP